MGTVNFLNHLVTLSIVIPSFNEEGNVVAVTEEVIDWSRRSRDRRVEVILVNDGSTDNSISEMENLTRKFPDVKLISHATNKGLGAAIYSGMTAATGDWITWLPADGQIAAENLDRLLRVADDCAICVLLRPDRQRSLPRRILTAAFHLVVRAAVSNRYERFSGVFLVRVDRVVSLTLVANTAVQNLAVVEHCVLNGARVVQVEGTLRPRTTGVSKVANIKTSIQTFLETVTLKGKITRLDR
jgi:dolichol-phosphate mannosyltransferase